MAHSAEYFPLFLAAIHTGLRAGKLAALKWIDIDWHGKFLKVRRNLVKGRLIDRKRLR